MICPSCQAPIAPETIFCPHCGTEIGALAFRRRENSAPGMPIPTALDALSAFAASVPTMETIAGAALSPDEPLPEGLPADALLYVVPVPPLVRLFGPSAAPDAPAPNRALALLWRAVPRRYATNLWFGALLGTLVALGLGLALLLPVAAVWARLQPTAPPFSQGINGIVVAASEAISALWLYFHVDPIKLLLFAEHVPLRVIISLSSGQGDAVQQIYYASPPLLGLLLLPALGLVVGGALSASTLSVRVPRYALARGALIGPFSGAALFVLATVAASRPSHIPLGGGGGAAVDYIVTPQPAWALLYGTLWGLLFGALGGWIAVSGRAWLSAALGLRRVGPHPRLAGALAGAGVALGCGLLLFIALAVGLAAFFELRLAGIGQPLNPFASPLPPPTSLRLLSNVAVFAVVFAMPFAVWLFALGAGAPWEIFQRATSGPSGSYHASIGLFGAQSQSMPHLWLLLALVPLVSYLAGGRVAARVAGARTRQEALLTGAMMALPLSALLALLAQAVSVSLQEVSTADTLFVGVAPSIGGTFLAVLIGGVVLGGLGGLSMLTVPELARFTRLPLAPLRLIERPFVALLDRLAGRNRALPLSQARRWFYDGSLAAIFFGALAAIADLITARLSTPAMFTRMQAADSILAALLVAVPPLCFGVALLAALLAPAADEAPAFDMPVQPQYYALVPAQVAMSVSVSARIPEAP